MKKDEGNIGLISSAEDSEIGSPDGYSSSPGENQVRLID